MKKEFGFITTPVIIAIVAILAIGGGVAYVATRPVQDNYTDLGQLETEQVQMNTQVQNTNNQASQTQPVASGAQQPVGAGGATIWTDPTGCISIVSPLPNSQVSIPFVIRGTVNTLGCWAFFEGEGGMVSIIYNGQKITIDSVDHLIKAQGVYYQSSDYPVPFSATIQNISSPVTGSAILQFQERGPFGEDGIPPSRLPKTISIPIIIQ